MDNNIPVVVNPKLRISIEKTKTTLGPYVKYPRLDVKYLQKPPFLFFHDIVTFVIRNHGFLIGLFSADELNRNILKMSKQKRINFLKKLVLALRMVSGDLIPDCNWNKLAKGKLPFLTNTILCSIANAITKKMNYGLAVKKLTGVLEIKDSTNIQSSQKRKFETTTTNTNISFPEIQTQEKIEIPIDFNEEHHKKRCRHLTIWDTDDVEDEDLNNENYETHEFQYEQERLLLLSSNSMVPFGCSTTTISCDNQQQRYGLDLDLEYEFESMDLS